MQALARQCEMAWRAGSKSPSCTFATADDSLRDAPGCTRRESAPARHRSGRRSAELTREAERDDSRMAQLLPQHSRIDSQPMRHLVGPLVAHDAAGHALNVRQQVIQRLDLAFGSAGGKLRACALDQVVKVLLRVLQCIGVGLYALCAGCRDQDRSRSPASAPGSGSLR